MTKHLAVSDSASFRRIGDGMRVQAVGTLVLRYGLVLVIGWIGLMKFTAYEANGIQPLVAHSPLMSWMYGFLTVRAFSNALGVVEVAIAILIALRHWSAKASTIGSAGVPDHWLIFWPPGAALAEWSPQYQMRFAKEQGENVKIAKVNVDEWPSLSSRFGIRNIPTLLFFKGGEVKDQVVGVTSKSDLLSRLKALQ